MENLKAFNIRIPRELWVFVKQICVEKECSMTKIMAEIIDQYKAKHEKKLAKKELTSNG